MGATCLACEADMAEVFTCKAELRPGVSRYGEDLPPEDRQPLDYELLPARCRNCGVSKGGVHHLCCYLARCLNYHDVDDLPEFYAQRVVCGCDAHLPCHCYADEQSLPVASVRGKLRALAMLRALLSPSDDDLEVLVGELHQLIEDDRGDPDHEQLEEFQTQIAFLAVEFGRAAHGDRFDAVLAALQVDLAGRGVDPDEADEP